MEIYVGVKIVKAEPKDKSGLPGYRVVNLEGEASWMPKDIFEATFQKLDRDFIEKDW